MTDEQLQVARNLFTEEHCSFAGDHYSYEDIAFYPKASMPIWCGGESRGGAAAGGTVRRRVVPVLRPDDAGGAGRRYANVQQHADGREVELNCCLSVEVTDEPVDAGTGPAARHRPSRSPRRSQRFAEVGVEHVALQFLVGRYPERVAQMEALMPALCDEPNGRRHGRRQGDRARDHRAGSRRSATTSSRSVATRKHSRESAAASARRSATSPTSTRSPSTFERIGDVDVLVNNAGHRRERAARRTTLDDLGPALRRQRHRAVPVHPRGGAGSMRERGSGSRSSRSPQPRAGSARHTRAPTPRRSTPRSG